MSKIKEIKNLKGVILGKKQYLTHLRNIIVQDKKVLAQLLNFERMQKNTIKDLEEKLKKLLSKQ
jgi:hypothetical protein